MSNLFFYSAYANMSPLPCRLLNGANGGSASNPNPVNKRRDLMLIAGLIYHPEMGLILFECGSTEDIDAVCPVRPLFHSSLFFFSNSN
jgi:hypothetical protein